MSAERDLTAVAFKPRITLVIVVTDTGGIRGVAHAFVLAFGIAHQILTVLARCIRGTHTHGSCPVIEAESTILALLRAVRLFAGIAFPTGDRKSVV